MPQSSVLCLLSPQPQVCLSRGPQPLCTLTHSEEELQKCPGISAAAARRVVEDLRTAISVLSVF